MSIVQFFLNVCLSVRVSRTKYKMRSLTYFYGNNFSMRKTFTDKRWMVSFSTSFFESKFLKKIIDLAIIIYFYILNRIKTEKKYRKLANWSLTRIESCLEYSPVPKQTHFNSVLLRIEPWSEYISCHNKTDQAKICFL